MTKTTILEVTNMHTNNKQLIINKENVFEYSKVGRKNTLIFDDSNLRGGFAQVPKVVLYDPLLDMGAKVCYTILLSYAWQKDFCFPSQKLLAENMGCSVRTAIRALKELQKFKLIRVERQGQGEYNIYHVCKLNDGYLPKQINDRGGVW